MLNELFVFSSVVEMGNIMEMFLHDYPKAKTEHCGVPGEPYQVRVEVYLVSEPEFFKWAVTHEALDCCVNLALQTFEPPMWMQEAINARNNSEV